MKKTCMLLIKNLQARQSNQGTGMYFSEPQLPPTRGQPCRHGNVWVIDMQWTYDNKQCGFYSSKQYMLICELCMFETSIPGVWLLQFSLLFVHHHEATTSSVSAQEIVQFPLHIRESSNISALQNRTSTAIPELLKSKPKTKAKASSSLYNCKYFGPACQTSLVLTQTSKVSADLAINTPVSQAS